MLRYTARLFVNSKTRNDFITGVLIPTAIETAGIVTILKFVIKHLTA